MDSNEVKIPDSDSEWEVFIAAWIVARESEKRTSDYDPEWWAVDAVSDWHFEELNEPLWQFILRTFEKEMSERTFAILAAGPLEDFLVSFGPSYIDRIEELARKNPRFNDLLGGVWKSLITDEIWARVEKARLNVW